MKNTITGAAGTTVSQSFCYWARIGSYDNTITLKGEQNSGIDLLVYPYIQCIRFKH